MTITLRHLSLWDIGLMFMSSAFVSSLSRRPEGLISGLFLNAAQPG